MAKKETDAPPEIWIAKKREGLSPVYHLKKPDQSHLPPEKRIEYVRYVLKPDQG